MCPFRTDSNDCILISSLYLIQGENEAHVISTLKIHWAVLNLKCRFNLASDNLPFMEIPVSLY